MGFNPFGKILSGIRKKEIEYLDNETNEAYDEKFEKNLIELEKK